MTDMKAVLGHNQVIVTDVEPVLIARARGRKKITLFNMSPDIVFIGGSNVTVENGFPIAMGSPFDLETTGEIWGIAKVHGSLGTSRANRPMNSRNRVCFIETFADK